MVIANFYFYDGDLTVQYDDASIAILFERELGVTNTLQNKSFVTAVVPLLVLCDASITTTRVNDVLSYEVSVQDKGEFSERIKSLTQQTEELSL